MPKASFRISAELYAQIQVLASELGTNDSEAYRLLLQRGLGATSAIQLQEELARAHALLRALVSEISLMSTFAEEHAIRSVPSDKREDYREMIRRKKNVAEQEINHLAGRFLHEMEMVN